MQIERLADNVSLHSVSWPLQRSLAKKQQTPLVVVVVLLLLERREWISGNEAGDILAWHYRIFSEQIEEWSKRGHVPSQCECALGPMGLNTYRLL